MQRVMIRVVLCLIAWCVGSISVTWAEAPKDDDRTPVPTTREAPKPMELEAFGTLLDDARKKLQDVQDYSCVFIKQERIQGKLHQEQTARMMVRAKPFSVWMKYTAPIEVSGQEVCYVDGKNDGKMRVKGAGLKGALGFLSLAVDDPRAMAQSRHTINEAGIAALVEQLTKLTGTVDGVKPKLTVAEYQFQGEKCHRVEAMLAEPTKSIHRVVVYFDKTNSLPIRFEAYDRGADKNTPGEMLECYTYTQLKLNAGVPEGTFMK